MSKLELGKIVQLTYMMLYNFERQTIARELEIGLDTVTNWTSFMREVSLFCI